MTPCPKPAKPVRDRAHMERVAELPCVICGAHPVQVHHVIHGRVAQRRSSDLETIPLCFDCHADLHAHPAAWKRRHGEDNTYLYKVRQQLNGESE